MLTDDLFEVSKAASGNIQVDLAPVELCSLIRQGMGELSDKMEQSGLDFRIHLPAQGVWVKADGKLLWRVVENLLSNVFKYAMPSSRVYLDVDEQEGKAAFTVTAKAMVWGWPSPKTWWNSRVESLPSQWTATCSRPPLVWKKSSRL